MGQKKENTNAQKNDRTYLARAFNPHPQIPTCVSLKALHLLTQVIEQIFLAALLALVQLAGLLELFAALFESLTRKKKNKKRRKEKEERERE